MSAEITILILTMNEEDNLPQALESVSGFADRVVVVDSGSTDRTVEIARAAGADVYENPFVNHSIQVNWALDNTGITTPWIFRLDADEVVLPDLARFIQDDLAAVGDDVGGIQIRRRIHFLGRWIRHGGTYPNYVLRIFRTDRGRCEMAFMDEHMVVEGRTIQINADIKDENTKSLRWWTAKHNWYSDRELFELLEKEQVATQPGAVEAKLLGTPVERKRWFKTHLYGRVPTTFRSWLYFMYRYYLKLGFLDGREGRIYHFLQGYWYRFLVDAKLYESKKYPRIKDDLVKEISQSLKD